MRAHIVPIGADGMPLEKYLRRAYPMCSGSMLRRALKQRDFRLSGVRMGANDAVRAGKELMCFMSDEYLLGEKLETVYRDNRLAIVIKPAGLTCQRDALGLGEDTLESRVREMFGTAYLVNRLDHYTGGVMPIALDEKSRDELMDAFSNHNVEKTYVCQVVGTPERQSARLVNYALKSPEESLTRVYDSPRDGALTMILSYEVLDKGSISRLRVHLETGRTHQIRAQLGHMGTPVLGDDRYGDRNANRRYGAAHQRLWCEHIKFTCGTYAGREFHAPAPF